mmetsp:Transcript_23567/g.55504  ORF Transcript_23567/g.55504 Transcript_23567/m.55504 type:complete len:149 (-) Transcript_23567:153-599(-)
MTAASASASAARTVGAALCRNAGRRTTSRAVVKRQFGSTAVARGGASPPLPPFARNPAPTEKLVENIDAVWDDGVAPEMCLDFDCQHVDSTEGLLWWLGGLTFFATMFQVVKATRPEDKKPCVNRIHNDMVVVGNPATGKLPGSSNVV